MFRRVLILIALLLTLAGTSFAAGLLSDPVGNQAEIVGAHQGRFVVPFLVGGLPLGFRIAD